MDLRYKREVRQLTSIIKNTYFDIEELMKYKLDCEGQPKLDIIHYYLTMLERDTLTLVKKGSLSSHLYYLLYIQMEVLYYKEKVNYKNDDDWGQKFYTSILFLENGIIYNLNLEKNKKKGDIEAYSFEEKKDYLLDEIKEAREEVLKLESTSGSPVEELLLLLNSELADIGAYLLSLYLPKKETLCGRLWRALKLIFTGKE
jgi:uncharacterized Rmd1/YagE family protein